jgi:cell fate (sporulation/competence/biofilm development) regulator YlbF (YheA/YmcA/DUF963 family)
MIATTEYIGILDQTDHLTQMILQSESVATYRYAYFTMQQDNDAQQLIQAFLTMKDHYEDVQRFGHYHPDYHSIMKDVRSAKRKMDMHETIAAFKVEERKLQRFLDEISGYIARSVSEQIIVPIDGLALTDGGCASSGGCGSGGSCSCKAS